MKSFANEQTVRPAQVVVTAAARSSTMRSPMSFTPVVSLLIAVSTLMGVASAFTLSPQQQQQPHQKFQMNSAAKISTVSSTTISMTSPLTLRRSSPSPIRTNSLLDNTPITRMTSTNPFRGLLVQKMTMNSDDDSTSNDEESVEEEIVTVRKPKIDSLIEDVSFGIRRLSWFSWWAQVILTTVASVTLMFTRNVMDLQTTTSSSAKAVASSMLPNYFLAGSGIVASVISIFWTWATRRLGRRLLRKPTSRIQAATMIRKDVTFGVMVNLIGVASALFGLEQVIGGLAIKVLTTTATTANAVYAAGPTTALLQPLDILVVQANANLLFSHFSSLVANLVMGRSILRLDPPSTDSDDRKGRKK